RCRGAPSRPAQSRLRLSRRPDPDRLADLHAHDPQHTGLDPGRGPRNQDGAVCRTKCVGDTAFIGRWSGTKSTPRTALGISSDIGSRPTGRLVGSATGTVDSNLRV